MLYSGQIGKKLYIFWSNCKKSLIYLTRLNIVFIDQIDQVEKPLFINNFLKIYILTFCTSMYHCALLRWVAFNFLLLDSARLRSKRRRGRARFLDFKWAVLSYILSISNNIFWRLLYMFSILGTDLWHTHNPRRFLFRLLFCYLVNADDGCCWYIRESLLS